MDAVRLVIYLAFLIEKSICDYQLKTSPSRQTAGLRFSFICTTDQSSLSLIIDKQPYCILGVVNGGCKLDPSCPSQNTYSCNSNLQTYTITITIAGSLVTNSLHGSKWKCIHPFGGDESNEVALYVNIPITKVNIMATPIDDNPVEIVTGIKQQFQCKTDAGRPSSRIQWYISGTNITSLASPQDDVCSLNCNGKVISSSVLTYIGNRGDEGKIIYCTALNIENQSVGSQNKTVEILYGPQQVNISSSNHIYTVNEPLGIVGPINCTADCNPICTMTWSGPNLQYGNTSELNIKNIVRNQAGNYTCTASNSVGSQISDTVFVIVNYGPKKVNILPNTEPYIVKVKTESVNPFNCTAECKPDCDMTWTGPDLPVGNTSVLILQHIQKRQTGNYTCIASNGVGSLESSSVRIIVHYGPDQVIIDPKETHYTVNETYSAIPISCTSDCKPKCTMTWSGPNLPVDNSSVLHLDRISRNQTGNYKCTAVNDVANKTSLNVNITVNFRPSVKDIFGNQTYNENDTVTISCNVESVPTADIRWLFEDKFLGNGDLVSVITNLKDSTLNIRPVGCLSMGTYNCTAINIIGQDTKAIDIDIKCSPRINELEHTVTQIIAVKDQEPLNITAPIVAFPKPNIYWMFDNNKTFVNVTHKMSNSFIKNRGFSHLYIENVSEADFGFYHIYAFNGIGKTEDYIYSFEVIPERKPNPPKNVTCIGRSDSVLVHWKSSFDGGDNQQFQIYVQKDGDANIFHYGQNYSDPGQNRYSEAAINQLTSDTTYHFKVRALNKYNYSMSEPATCNTTTAVGNDQGNTNTLAIGAGTGIGGAIIALIVITVVILFLRRKQNNEKLGQDKELINRSVAKAEDNDDDGLKENPLYISSVQEDVGAVYRTVDKYREKDKDKANLTDANTVYTQVVKQNKKDMEYKGIEMGCVCENSDDITHGNADDVYTNSGIENKSGDKNVYTQKKNKDGLIYADLDLAPTVSGKRFVIRGSENRNNYAVIDLSKTAEPMPSDSDNDDNQSEKNIEEE